MNIAYFEPLSRAFNRMKVFLFKPFDISRWFVVGFTAFLAGLMDWHSGSGGKFNLPGKNEDFDFYELSEVPQVVWEWLMEHPVWFVVISIGIIILVILLIVLTWISSRGKFMFLDNVVHNRALIAKPWTEYKTLGDSLFLWRLGFGFITLIITLIFFGIGYSIFATIYEKGFSAGSVLIIIAIVLAFLLWIFMVAFVSLLLNDFVVPVMYKNNLRTTAAWKNYLKLFSRNTIKFILYALFVFVLWIFITIGLVLLGLFTCCIGFLILIIPYINSVVLLPVSYTFRAFSLEFLAQFGNEYNLFPGEENVVVTEPA